MPRPALCRPERLSLAAIINNSGQTPDIIMRRLSSSKRPPLSNNYTEPSTSKTKDNMVSPLAPKGTAKKRDVSAAEPRQLSLRNSTFEPANLAEIPNMNTAAELAELASKNLVTNRQNLPLVQDFGSFKVGTAQYSHSHWNKEPRMRAMSSTLNESTNELKVDPDALKPDADSVRGEICGNGSSSSLSSMVSNLSLSDNISVRRIRPRETSTEKATKMEVSSLIDEPTASDSVEDAPESEVSFLDDDSIATDPAEEDYNTSTDTIRNLEASTPTKVARPKAIDNANNIGSSPIGLDHLPPALRARILVLPEPIAPGEIHPALRGQSYFQSEAVDLSENHPAQHGQPLVPPTPLALPEVNESPKGKEAGELKKDVKFKCDDKRKPKNDHILNIVKKNSAADQVISIHEAAFEGPEDMPPPKTPNSRKSLSGSFGRARGATLRSTPGTDGSKRTASSTLRSVSDIFRGKSTPEPERFDTEKFVRDKEKYLRTITVTLPNPNNTMFPKHPNTNKPWMHRNLRCTECTDTCCKKCGRACCAYKAAIEGKKNHPGGENYYRACGHADEIAKFMPYGRELPTFLKCTDCEEMFCPDCCGECADPVCKLVCCRKCKRDPWVNCDWHDGH